MSTPSFAVVGHPNKGKSSIVANLTRQDAVEISNVSGTTTQSQSFSLSVGGKELYSLVDTPGFQRPRQVLSWLEKHAANASQRSNAVQQFLTEFQATDSFKDETQLLKPIMAGAGILYVVDGSVPYSPEYEAEMSILQWTGQPRLALINPIGGEQFLEQWQQALSQYFSVVRVFNPMTADADKQRAVLSAFAEIYEPWRESIGYAISQLGGLVEQLKTSAAQLGVDTLLKMLQHQASIKVPDEFVEAALREAVRQQYREEMRQIELGMQRQMQELLAHYDFKLDESSKKVQFPDVFDTDSWFMFGLNRRTIMALSASAGAAAGVVVDIGVGGSSLMAGALAGGVLTGAASMFALMNPERLKVKGVPLAGKSLLVGPVKDLNFSFVLLGRIVGFLKLLLARTHADRSVQALPEVDLNACLSSLSKTEQIKLTRILSKAHRGLSDSDRQRLSEWVLVFAQ